MNVVQKLFSLARIVEAKKKAETKQCKEAMKNEFGKRCQLCYKYKKCRMFYKPINGKWLRLCKECWEKSRE